MLISYYQTFLRGCVFRRLSEDEYLSLIQHNSHHYCIVPTNEASVRSDWDYSGISQFATSFLLRVTMPSLFPLILFVFNGVSVGHKLCE